MKSNEFERIFKDTKNRMISNVKASNNRFYSVNNFESIDKDLYSHTFTKLINRQTSNTKVKSNFLYEKYFDVFSIKISRKYIKEKALSEVNELINFDDSYTYIIETSVI